jgi:hypothetical protein
VCLCWVGCLLSLSSLLFWCLFGFVLAAPETVGNHLGGKTTAATKNSQ